MTTNIQELKQQLAIAEKAERARQEEELLASFQAFAGRSFSYVFSHYGGVSLGFVRYGKKVEKNTFHPEQIDVTSDYVHVVSPIKKKQTCGPIGVTRGSNRDSYRSTFDLTQHHRAEIPAAQFKEMWELPVLLAQAMWDRYSKEWSIDPEKPLSEEEKVFEPDFPFIKLEPYESTLLSKNPFFLNDDYVYLVTPNSKEYARKQLDEAERNLWRGSHLFEACDMKYVENRTSSIASVRKKLGLKP